MVEVSTSSEIIAAKQNVLRMAPYSGARINDRDVLFLMREPGVDVLVYDGGSVSIRDGWGQQKKVRRYRDLPSALDTLFDLGYKPVNIFTGDEYNEYERKHLQYKRQKDSSVEFLQPYDMSRKKEAYTPSNLDYNVEERPSKTIQQKKERPTAEFNLPDPNRELANIRKGIMMRTVSSPADFENFFAKEASVMNNVSRQMGINPFTAIAGRKKNPKKEAALRKLMKEAGI